MWMNPDLYLKRLAAALENVVAPEIDDDFARGQLYAVSELINQLTGKLEYKRDLVGEDIKAGHEALVGLLADLEDVGAPRPGGIVAAIEEMGKDPKPIGVERRGQVEALLCDAIDHFHDHKQEIGAEAAAKLDKELRDLLTRQATKELGRMKPPQFEKISRSKKPERKR